VAASLLAVILAAALASILIIAATGSAHEPPLLPASDEILDSLGYQAKTPSAPAEVTEAAAIGVAKTFIEDMFGKEKTGNARTAARYVLVSDVQREDFPVWAVTITGIEMVPPSCGPGVPMGEEWKLDRRECPQYDTVHVLVDAVHGDVAEFTAVGSRSVGEILPR